MPYTDKIKFSRLNQNTLSLLITTTWNALFPSSKLFVGPTIHEALFFSSPDLKIRQKELSLLSKEINQKIASGSPINRIELPYQQTLKALKKSGNLAAVNLLQFKNDPIIPLYENNQQIELAVHPILENLAELAPFTLLPFEHGFLARFLEAQEPPQKSLLFNIHTEFTQWSKSLKASNVAALNSIISNKESKNFIQINEMLQENKIASIAKEIRPKNKIVLIAGPSSSGKTTFTKKLALNLQVQGFAPTLLSLDDYYKGKSLTPLGPDGQPDYESIQALDLAMLNQNLKDLLEGKEVQTPIFDFHYHRPSKQKRTLQISEKGILLIEGIHGLNPELTSKIPDSQKFFIYISALSQLKLDDHTRIPTSDGRLLRRIVRDSQFRNTPAEKTFDLWPAVRRGEHQNIFPYQENANAVFNSALNYEISVLKFFASPLLRAVKPSSPHYPQARYLQALLSNFLDIAPDNVPPRSILREFIGGSHFNY